MRYMLAAILAIAATANEPLTNASVSERWDEFSDARTIQLTIDADGGGFLNREGMSVHCDGDDSHTVFLPATKVSPEYIVVDKDGFSYVSVRHRFDRELANRVRADWLRDANMASFRGWQASDWMIRLEASDRLIAKIAEGRVMRFDLAKAKPAIRDYMDRCATHSWLTKAEADNTE